MSNTNSNNPLMSVSALKNKAVPFNLVRDEHFLPAIKAGIETTRKNIQAIKDNPEEPDFQNTIVALEVADQNLGYAHGVFSTFNGCDTNEDRQKLAQEISPLVAELYSDISLDEKLFQKVKVVYNKKDQLDLNKEEMMLLENTYSGFSRNGALLDEEKKSELRKINEELSVLSPKFSENVLKSTNSFELHITEESDLAGLPDSATEAAKETAQQSGHSEGWLFNLQFPSYLPFMTYAENRELREEMYRAFSSRAFNDEFDNQENVKKFVELRQKRAELLGYETHAHFVLEKRMAETPEKVSEFLNQLREVSLTAAQNDVKELQDFADKNDGPNPLMPWDFSFYSEKLKQEKFQFSDEDLRPYFKLENVVDGAFEHARRLYQIEFRPSSEYPVYHEDVKTFEVYKEGTDELVGLFYADFFPRPSKRSGAWMSTYIDQGLFAGEIVRPHVTIVCNFTKPTASKPSLITHNEVTTLFHEFGHALHGLLSDATYQSIGGPNVYWDFVELPSQIMENWAYEKESLDIFAKHYETGETIPEELTKKLKDSANFQAGYTSLRQVSFGYLDMAWHHDCKGKVEDVGEFEKAIMEKNSVMPLIPSANMSCSFGHIFAGGYSSGYYSYKWAEALDADAFELFKEKGLFDKESAKKFKDCILSKGGTEHPMELYKRFRGREPDPKALLRRSGLI